MVILLDFLIEEMTEKTDITERTGDYCGIAAAHGTGQAVGAATGVAARGTLSWKDIKRTGGLLLRHSRSPRDRTGGCGSHGSGGTGGPCRGGAGMSILLIDLHIKLIVTNFAER